MKVVWHHNTWPWGKTVRIIKSDGSAIVEMSFDDGQPGVCFLSVLSDLEKECEDFPTTDEEMAKFLATHPKVELPEKYKTPDWMLEKSEKPTNIDFEQELYKHFGQVKDFTLGMQIGKYFYNLGKQSKQPVCEGLEEEIERYLHSLGVGYGGWVDGMEDDDLRGIARHFAQWGAEHAREQMMIQWAGNNLKDVIEFTGKSPRFNEWFKSLDDYEDYVRQHGNIFKMFNDDGSHLEVPVGAWIVKTPDKRCVASKFTLKQPESEKIAAAYQLGLADKEKMMMKEAVEGEVCGRVYDHINVRFADGVCKYLEPKNISHIPADVSKYNIGQKVRIIIVKED